MWNIKKVINKGDYDYALVPEHPNATKNGYVLMHRIVMENHLGRILSTNEVVHHIDGNRKNNDISNLQLMENADHCRMHALRHGRKAVILRCPQCGKVFEKYRNKSFLQKPSKYNCTCCSPTCRGKLSRDIQLHGLTPEIQSRINNCLVREFIKYETN